MSALSKYFQVTNQILLEYKTDQYKITSIKTDVGEEHAFFYMFQGNDGNQYCLEKSAIPRSKYVKEDKSTYYYGGSDVVDIDFDEKPDDPIFGGELYLNLDVYIGAVIRDSSGNSYRDQYINFDTIRLYILTGYTMNNVAGYSVKVQGNVKQVSCYDEYDNVIVKRINGLICLLDWYMPKDELKDNIHWMKSPLYLNSKFYDRYIEIRVPAAYDLAINKRNIDYVFLYEDGQESKLMRGYVDQFSGVYIDFATILSLNVEYETGTTSGESSFILDVPKEFAIFPESNSNNFNVRIFEDKDTHSIMYYPVYGEINESRDFDYNLMAAIDTGNIPMIDLADMDNANEGIDEFIDMYGDEVMKWIIINELSVTYNYEEICQNVYNDQDHVSFTEYYTNTIDYTGKQQDPTEFWKSKFVPYIQQRLGYICKSITLSYSCHLFNRMNNMDIVRSASMVIKDPYKYDLTSISTSNIVKYKIVNKITNDTVYTNSLAVSLTLTKYVKEYYDVTNLVIKSASDDNSTVYAQGNMVLKLKKAGSNYMLKLYNRNNDNSLLPVDLSGPYNYKLVFPSISQLKIEISPNVDSANGTNLVLGQIMFYISSDKATLIMMVPASERYFALMTSYPDDNTTESSIYEGKVEWYVS